MPAGSLLNRTRPPGASFVIHVTAASLLLIASVGCMGGGQTVRLPSNDRIVRDQLIIFSDFSIPRRHRLLDELSAQRSDLVQDLSLPESDEPVRIFLFEKEDKLKDYLRENHPDFGDRRALFVKSDTTLTVYAYWGDRVAEDLRHEVTHGYLHAVVPRLPLWMDEGIAENYEVGRGRRGLNRRHITLLRQRFHDGTWQPDLAGLESIDAASSLQQIDYAEAWLWVHWHLYSDASRRDRLQRYLDEVRSTQEAPRFSDWIRMREPDADQLLLDHLTQLAEAL